MDEFSFNTRICQNSYVHPSNAFIAKFVILISKLGRIVIYNNKQTENSCYKFYYRQFNTVQNSIDFTFYEDYYLCTWNCQHVAYRHLTDLSQTLLFCSLGDIRFIYTDMKNSSRVIKHLQYLLYITGLLDSNLISIR